jgi:hypothetical protein
MFYLDCKFSEIEALAKDSENNALASTYDMAVVKLVIP